MLKRHEIPENTSINITPLLDVIFQLLVFFVLTSSLVRPTQIELQLPESTTGVKTPDTQGLVISYRMEGDKPAITLNAEPLADVDALVPALRVLRGDPQKPQARLDIQIDRAVPYQDVIRLMDAARDTGFPKFSLQTLASTPGARR
ncbi:MAG: biopolymer transporter ExbD [Lentisphaerae bacterium]|nr:biopolymer transporter ExbD [Lentisphaerota bacterium]